MAVYAVRVRHVRLLMLLLFVASTVLAQGALQIQPARIELNMVGGGPTGPSGSLNVKTNGRWTATNPKKLPR